MYFPDTLYVYATDYIAQFGNFSDSQKLTRQQCNMTPHSVDSRAMYRQDRESRTALTARNHLYSTYEMMSRVTTKRSSLACSGQKLNILDNQLPLLIHCQWAREGCGEHPRGSKFTRVRGVTAMSWEVQPPRPPHGSSSTASKYTHTSLQWLNRVLVHCIYMHHQTKQDD